MKRGRILDMFLSQRKRIKMKMTELLRTVNAVKRNVEC